MIVMMLLFVVWLLWMMCRRVVLLVLFGLISVFVEFVLIWKVVLFRSGLLLGSVREIVEILIEFMVCGCFFVCVC